MSSFHVPRHKRERRRSMKACQGDTTRIFRVSKTTHPSLRWIASQLLQPCGSSCAKPPLLPSSPSATRCFAFASCWPLASPSPEPPRSRARSRARSSWGRRTTTPSATLARSNRRRVKRGGGAASPTTWPSTTEERLKAQEALQIAAAPFLPHARAKSEESCSRCEGAARSSNAKHYSRWQKLTRPQLSECRALRLRRKRRTFPRRTYSMFSAK
mmetsp:Transcript_10242/g.15067  ORF Transcript_10242/g.15067 Transcript_10242/m.15067 type:complete len:214 (-) Transcript_10242:133-774(-)